MFFLNFIFSQKISLKEVNHKDTVNIENVVKYLSKQLVKNYKEKDSITYYNLFRFNLINENYNLALSQLDSVRNRYVKKNPELTKSTGSQFEIYINTLKRNPSKKEFDKVYEEEFRKKYENLNFKSQVLFPKYFTYDKIQTKKEINDIFNNNINKDSIEISDAIKLCKRYNTYNVAKKSFELGKRLIKKIDDEKYIIYDSINITTKNKNILTLNIVLNRKNSNIQNNTILINTIYSDVNNIIDAKEFANNGYAGVILNTRGKYLSPDAVSPFENEAHDINEAVNWIIKQPWSNGKVGMIGGSYLGFSQWAATKNLHQALKTIVPEAAVGIGTMDFPMNNHIFTSYALRWLDFVTNTKMADYDNFRDEKKWNSIYKKWYESGKSFRKLDSISGKSNPIFQKWLNHPYYDNYWAGMIPYKQEFSKINIPILTITGYYDSDQLGALYYLRNHYKYNKNANHYMIIGPYDHAGAQGNITNEIQKYTIDPVANIDLHKIWFEWFDYILKGKEKPSFLKNTINYQVMGINEWKSANSIENFDKNKVRYYLNNENNKLVSSSNKEINKFSSLKVDLSDRSDANRLLALEYNIVEDKIDTDNSLLFTTDTFENSFEFTGNFSGNIKFTLNKKDVDLKAYLYELMPDGKYFLLSTYLGRASYNNSEKRKLLLPNKREEILISNNEFVSKKIQKGSKLVLILGVVKNPYYQINYGTGKDVSDETIADAKEPMEIKFYNDSYIEIPISTNK